MTDALRRIDKVRQIRRAIGLTIGAAIYSAGLNLFLIPNHVIDGGVTGISLLIQALTGIPFSVLIVLLNVPFFYMGYKSLGPRLAASSMFAIIVLSLCSSRLEKMMPATNDPFLSTIFGGIIIGLGVGIVIKNGGRRMARKSWRSGWTAGRRFLSAKSSCFSTSSSWAPRASSSAGTAPCIPSSRTSSARA